MPFTLEITRRSYCTKIARAQFENLLDSESHVTNHAAMGKGQMTLGEKLAKLPGVSEVEYSGHMGAYVYITITAEDDNESLHAKISDTIENHLTWCSKVKRDLKRTTDRQ